MFQPQPTPFAYFCPPSTAATPSSPPYGIAPAIDFGFSTFPAGGSGGGGSGPGPGPGPGSLPGSALGPGIASDLDSGVGIGLGVGSGLGLAYGSAHGSGSQNHSRPRIGARLATAPPPAPPAAASPGAASSSSTAAGASCSSPTSSSSIPTSSSTTTATPPSIGPGLSCAATNTSTVLPQRFAAKRQRLSLSLSSSSSSSPPASCTDSGALLTSSPVSTAHSAPLHHHYRPTNFQQVSHPVARMESPDQHGVEAQQEAAKDYQPSLEGAPVGDKTPSDAITHEYAKADPIYVEKTIALPQTYSHYRPIQGDGNCGWRAIGFSYFEKLIDCGDAQQVEGEIPRLMSLNNMLANVGGYDYFEDFFEEFITLVRDVASSMGNPAAAHMIVLQRWNDASIAGSLIYYLRLLAATYLKANASTYDPFIPSDMGVAGHCSQSIELPDREIEHLGITALAHVLLKPVNFALEIAYLDRSPGDQVNSYRFPEEANGQDLGTLNAIIYLLYRPDHYDILYREERAPVPISAPVAPASMQVHRVNGFTHDLSICPTGFNGVDFTPLSNIPGFSPAVLTPLAPPLTSPMSETYTNSPQHGDPNPWMNPFDEMAPSGPTPQQTGLVSPPLTTAALSPGANMDPGSMGGMAQHQNAGYHIRFSPVQLDYDEGKRDFPEPAFQVTTNTFKNSVYNRAHYGNPDFHPEEWSPEEESIDARIGGKRKVKKEP